MSKPIAIIFGAGQRIGASTAQMLRSKGYRVACIARNTSQASDADSLSLAFDLSNPANVTTTFKTIRESWGEPSVIVYNGSCPLPKRPQESQDMKLKPLSAAAVHPTAASEPFAISLEAFNQDLAINTTSAFVALKEAIASFTALPPSSARTFLYTGNCLNEAPLSVGLLTLGVGKSATAHMIAFADKAYGGKGWR